MIPAAHVIFVLDASGSMDVVRQQTVNAFNGFVETLQLCKGAEIKFSLITFNWHVNTVFRLTHIQEVKPLDCERYVPGGGTTLYDATGLAIDHGLREGKPKDEKVIVVIQTDGEDGASNRYSLHAIRDRILGAQAEGCEFIFMGMDSWQLRRRMESRRAEGLSSFSTPGDIGEAMGIPPEAILRFDADDKEIAAAFEAAAVGAGSVASRLSEHASVSGETGR